MTRHAALMISLALFSASSGACDKPGAAESQKEEQASERAAQAKAEAAQKAQTAQAAAEKDIATARIEFEKNREDYRHTRAGDLSDLDKSIASMEAKAKTASGKVQTDRQMELASIRTMRDAFVGELHSLDSTTPAAWDQAKANVDRTWSSLKTAVDKAK